MDEMPKYVEVMTASWGLSWSVCTQSQVPPLQVSWWLRKLQEQMSVRLRPAIQVYLLNMVALPLSVMANISSCLCEAKEKEELKEYSLPLQH